MRNEAKETFKEMVESIPVPKEKVLTAIHTGTYQGQKNNQWGYKSRSWAILGTVAVMIALILGIGSFSPTVGKALSQLPWIGGFYEQYSDELTNSLFKEGDTQNLNLVEKKNSITVSLIDAYYEGDIVSIAGSVKGKIPNLNNENELSVELFSKKDGKIFANPDSHSFEATKDGYKFQLLFKVKGEQLADTIEFPLTIKYINGVSGNWYFNIPLKQSKLKSLPVDKPMDFGINDVKFQVENIQSAKKTAILNLDMSTNMYQENNQLQIMKITDRKGHNILKSPNVNIIDDDSISMELNQVPKKGETYTVEADYWQLEYSQLIPVIDTKTILKPSFDPFNIRLLDSKVADGKAVIKYQVQNNKPISEFEHNLGYALRVSRKDYHDLPVNNTAIFGENIQNRSEVTVVDKDAGIYQNIFDLTEKSELTDASIDELYFSVEFSPSIIKTKPLTTKIIFY